MFIRSASCSVWDRWNSRDINDSKIYTRREIPLVVASALKTVRRVEWHRGEALFPSNFNQLPMEIIQWHFISLRQFVNRAMRSTRIKRPSPHYKFQYFFLFVGSAATSRAFRLLHAPHRWFKRKFPNALCGPANPLTRSVPSFQRNIARPDKT